MDSRRASEQNGTFFDDPHPERLSPPDRRDVTPWHPFVGACMSSTNLNNEDYFSDHPKQLPSLDALFRAQAQLSPEYFFRILERQSGDNHCSQDDYQRAVFLFRRLQIRAPDHFAIKFLSCCYVACAFSFASHFLKSGG